MTRKTKIGAVAGTLLGAYLLSMIWAVPALNHAWWYLQENANRTYGKFVSLTLASAFYPPCWGKPAAAFTHIATRDRWPLEAEGRYKVTPALLELIPLAEGNVPHETLDTRLMTRGRLKARLADFKRAHGDWRLWCCGRYDYVVTAGKHLLADDLLELFSDARTFDRFAAAGIYAPADLFACFVGTAADVEGALEKDAEQGALGAGLAAPRLAFDRTGGVEPAYLTPYDPPAIPWLERATLEKGVFDALTNRIDLVMGARRFVLRGLESAAQGASTNAIADWASAAQINPRDPLLVNIISTLDVEARARLKCGDAKGALRCCENRLEIMPEDVAAVHNFGICLKRAGKPGLAARVFLKAVQREPLEDAHRLELIECAAAAGHVETAIRQLDVLIKRHPNDLELKKRRTRLIVHEHFKKQ